MRARGRLIEAKAKQARNLALLTAYWAGRLARADFDKLGSFGAFLDKFENRKLTRAEVIHRLDAMAARGVITRH